MKGYLQVYTGAGKGKTTAAIGLSVRALGAGMRVFLGQFIKKGDYSEIRALRRFSKNIKIRQFGRGRFLKGKPLRADIEAARHGMSELRNAMLSGKYDIIIADELNPAVRCGLVPVNEVLRLVDEKPPNVELIITGRDAPRCLMQRADLVTDMRCVKHYYANNIKARRGIEH